MIELRHIRYFVAVAEELHFGRAAARLRLAQPALSQQIRRLEDELKVQLFHRTKRRVALTEPGAIFLEKSRLILCSMDAAISSAQRANRGEIGELSVGFVGSAAFGLLPQLLKAFRERFPSTQISLLELTTSQQLAGLHSGQIKVGLLRPPISDGDVKTEIITREEWKVAVARSHPLHHHSTVKLRDLAQEPFITTPRTLGPGFYDQVVSLCLQSGFSPKVVQEAVQMQTIVSLVTAGIGIALVPSSVEHLGRKGVLYRPLEGSPTTQMALAWFHDDRSPISHAFLQVARNTFVKVT